MNPAEELQQLKELLRKYLRYGSTDGNVARQVLREQLKAATDEKAKLPEVSWQDSWPGI